MGIVVFVESSRQIMIHSVKFATEKVAVHNFLRGTCPERAVEARCRVPNLFPRMEAVATRCPLQAYQRDATLLT